MKSIALLCLLVTNAVAADFDHDGRDERVVVREGKSLVESRDASGKWAAADFQLPEAVAARETRFFDLNGDDFDDLVCSDDAGFYIALWSTQVKPQLGWGKGWSQFVRAGERKGAANEPPSFINVEARIEGAELVVGEKRVALRDLIAFDMPPPKPPEAALACFRVRDGFAVELVAAEPEVVDPASFEWGADGRLWVVEMRDYPLGVEGGGVVKILTDADGDGRCEKATVFLDGLAFPSGVMPWRDGVLISAAPDIIFAADRDGDGRAEFQEVLFTGFTPGNQQHRVNGFEWGLDGWIYAANGDSGGTVTSVKTGAEIEISGRDVRFRPDTGEIEAVSSQSQFGRRRDDFGNWFGNNNPTWLWHVGLPEHYLRRNPKLAVKSPKLILANYEDPTRVFPASAPVERPNQPWSLNYVTSACSPSPYRDAFFGADFETSVFISEPVHNVVHREVLERDGAGFRSHRAAGEEQAEFLASTDPWFRPTTLKTGPDGALYVADFYRFVLEHPEWISPETQARLDLRAGEDRGRIYRVVPVGKERRKVPDLAQLEGAELAKAMDSPSGWQRDTVQRLFQECGMESDGVAALVDLLALTKSPQVRVQALATLGMAGKLESSKVVAALSDPHPGVRIEALRQSEAFALESGDAVFEMVAALAGDVDGGVRLQAGFSLGAFPVTKTEGVLARLAATDGGDEWIRTAVLSSLRPESALFETLNAGKTTDLDIPALPVKPSSADRAKVIAAYAGIEDLKGDAEKGRTHFQALCATCHRFRGEGNEVGPDLGMTRGKPVDWLLGAILDPSSAVEARYTAWKVTLKSGDVITGIIGAETANSVTFRLLGGFDHPVLREDIEKLESLGTSLMPAGFESALDPQAIANLLEWIRADP